MAPFPAFRTTEVYPWRWILLGGGAAVCLLLVIIGVWTWWSSYQSRGLAEVQWATLRIRALQDSQAPAETRAEAVRALQSVIQRYPRLKALPRAAYQLGNFHYQAKAFEEARNAYQLALDKGATGALATLCRLGIGYTWEDQGDYAKALAAFDAARQKLTPGDFLYDEVLLGVARSQELLNQPDRAREVYQQLLKEMPQAARAEDARARLARLEAAPKP